MLVEARWASSASAVESCGTVERKPRRAERSRFVGADSIGPFPDHFSWSPPLRRPILRTLPDVHSHLRPFFGVKNRTFKADAGLLGLPIYRRGKRGPARIDLRME